MEVNFYHKKEIGRLLDIAWDIKKNPSKLHASFRHKDAPGTPDFDWDVYVDRIDNMMEQDSIKNSPIRKARIALNALNADLTYDNRNKAKKLIKSLVDELAHQERQGIQERLADREQMKEEQKMFRISTVLTDEFWKNIGQPEKKECQEPSRVLEKEKNRYEQFKREQDTDRSLFSLSRLGAH